MSTLVESRFFEVTAPQEGSSCVRTVTAADSLDLRKVGNQTQNVQSSTATTVGALKSFIDIQNDGAVNLYISFGKTAPTPDPTKTGTNTAGNCYMIPAGAMLSGIWLREGVDNFIGFVAGTAAGPSGSTVMRLFMTSRTG